MPTIGSHLNSGDVLVTLLTDQGPQPLSTPFSGTVQKVNDTLQATPQQLLTLKQNDNWLVQLKAD
ncbi:MULTISPECIES: hypothetical protein [Lactiplantibacillus]|uniref:Lipoyl-binding domain-containing protein n=2 Tax=Lactiplantibacillus pentosus TaxID=1589 RepID=A0AAW8WJ20_LACPE|nr:MULTISPECIES: hypothetical protein [Lactiplantibacillus]MDT7034167.1 hypothetical protein [Lactiplantibacillus pentosus]MDT7040293.1 hypothetical protein [Lactiplantibacillus pentosus]